MADDLPALVLAHRVDVGGMARCASSEASNFSSSVMSEALGAVPLVARELDEPGDLDRPPGLLRCAIPSSNHTGG